MDRVSRQALKWRVAFLVAAERGELDRGIADLVSIKLGAYVCLGTVIK